MEYNRWIPVLFVTLKNQYTSSRVIVVAVFTLGRLNRIHPYSFEYIKKGIWNLQAANKPADTAVGFGSLVIAPKFRFHTHQC